MATFESRYITAFNYAKTVNDVGAVTVINRINQKNNQSFPLMHAADISIGDDEAAENRLNIKLQTLDTILREIYGRKPSELEALVDGRTDQEIAAAQAAGETGAKGLAGIESLARVAQILNNRTETIDDRLKDMKIVKTISIGAQGTSTDDTLTSSAGNLVADTSGDTMSIAAENMWIILKANANGDSFTIGHYKKAFSPTTATADLNNSGTIDLIELGYDLAGHITSKKTTTYTLPYNYKTIAIGTQSESVADITANTTSVVADTQVATVTFKSGNKWIKLAGSNTAADRSITFAHALSALAAGAHVSTWSHADQTPSFGDTVTVLIPKVSFTTDAAGHVTAYSYDNTTTTNITIPKGSIATQSGNAGNVLTGLTLTDTTMAFERVFSYVADLALTNYDASAVSVARPTGQTATTTIAATDTLKAALAKVQSYLISNHNAIEQAVIDLVGGADANHNTLKKVGDLIDNHMEDDDNPHGVNKSQVGLSNVTNDAQIVALGSLAAADQNKVAVWTAANTLAVGHKLEQDVTSESQLTDTTYEQATDDTLGLTKLYETADALQTDGAVTSAAMVTLLQGAVDDAINKLFANFNLTGASLIMPTTVTWGVEDDELTYELDKTFDDLQI